MRPRGAKVGFGRVILESKMRLGGLKSSKVIPIKIPCWLRSAKSTSKSIKMYLKTMVFYIFCYIRKTWFQRLGSLALSIC